MEKMPLYGQHGIPYLWLIDPVAKTLDVFVLEGGRWVISGLYVEDAKVRAVPFNEIEFALSDLWYGG